MLKVVFLEYSIVRVILMKLSSSSNDWQYYFTEFFSFKMHQIKTDHLAGK